MSRLKNFKPIFYLIMRLVTGAILATAMSAVALALYLFLKFSAFEVICSIGVLLVLCGIGYVISVSIWQIKEKDSNETN